MLMRPNAGWLVAVLVALSGCTSVALNGGFDDVSATVEQRSGMKLFWNNGTDLDEQAAEKLASLLRNILTVDDAVQIALLNNRELQALYSDLVVAQADLVQAGLLNNPIFDASIKWPTSGGGKPELELAAVMNFLDIFYLPLRKRVASARFEEAKSRVTGSVLDLGGECEPFFTRIRRMSRCSSCARLYYRRSPRHLMSRGGFMKRETSATSTLRGKGRCLRQGNWRSDPSRSQSDRAMKR
jgi:cobalt-zinc-cadmium efflux system outer membrane protein